MTEEEKTEQEARATEIIKKGLSHIYCHNCANRDNDDDCDGCNRKAMYWSINPKAAQELAKEILLTTTEEEKAELKKWKDRAGELAGVALAAWDRMQHGGYEPEWVQTARDVKAELKKEAE